MALHPRFSTLLVLAPAAWLCAEAMAEDRYGCEQPISVAYTRNVVFFHDDVGIDPDLIAELGKRTGCQFETSIRPRDEIWRKLENGELQMGTSGVATPQRRAYTYLLPYLYMRNKLIVRDDLGEMNSLDAFHDMPGARLGVIAGYRHGAYIDGMLRILRAEGRVLEYKDDATRFTALLNGNVEGVIGHEMNLEGAVSDRRQRDRFHVIDVMPGPATPHNLMLSRKRFTPAQSAEWMRLMETLWLDGTLARIMRKNAPPQQAEGLLDSGYRYSSTDRGW
ncbi:transporter substrate-binding domain-containing protein [Pseudomonas nicosulfuronedens]|uniref:Amino acid ABC transporter substrate-binding protein n=1 Tax=Pseudomonas nicosulfuronedens TaxID=2571105 RepID=A0A5R9RCC2_9PSED|nr:transporter substrate-binding domain-containing protein [Pseudomonas nicosulfuronedens]MDH1007559.1 transporter substrate-binding domain-containing protein [Pseudomonas nicosulfuronedens]MDH1977604.1 transporter substrate-binding domain-containing protein [Pseudomonas nicosulfuronedens]MDH2025796.1 transporter substrate-binding domain-containing protein [Pseudomonas nicosulfuronedens]TLX79702.1 amino acid ABC transporter substrate-binding protein [Pseudomonas nicosulfuronedens]